MTSDYIWVFGMFLLHLDWHRSAVTPAVLCSFFLAEGVWSSFYQTPIFQSYSTGQLLGGWASLRLRLVWIRPCIMIKFWRCKCMENGYCHGIYFIVHLLSLSLGRAMFGGYCWPTTLMQNTCMVMVHGFVTMLFRLVRNEKTCPVRIFLTPLA